MHSIAKTKYITLTDASRIIPGQVHKNTIRRWCDHGFKGIVLKSWRIANRRVTSIEAIDEFMAATSDVAHRTVGIPRQRIANTRLDQAG